VEVVVAEGKAGALYRYTFDPQDKDTLAMEMEAGINGGKIAVLVSFDDFFGPGPQEER
jgi:hypothetical protein